MNHINKRSPLLSALLIMAVFSTGTKAEPVPPEEGPPDISAVQAEQAGQEIFLAHADRCLAVMESTALDMSVRGVAVIAFIPGDSSLTWISRMKVVGTLADSNANFLAVACSKAAEMADTYMNSGSAGREPLHGEFGYQGGLIEKVGPGYLLAVFSGATGEQDTEIARHGLEQLKQAFDQ
jgi:hypothetical protein